MAELLSRLESRLTFKTSATGRLLDQVDKMNRMIVQAYFPVDTHVGSSENDGLAGPTEGMPRNRAVAGGVGAEDPFSGRGSGRKEKDQYGGNNRDREVAEVSAGTGLDDCLGMFDLSPDIVFPDLADWFTHFV